MLICVGRIAEAKQLAADMGDTVRPSLVVLTADTRVNLAFSGTTPEAGQVLITTQQRIEEATDGRRFDDVASLHYQDQPRMIRVWDEAWLPGVAVTLGRDDLLLLLQPLRKPYPRLADAIDDFACGLKGRPDGDLIAIPDFEEVCGVSMSEMLATIAEPSRKRGSQAHVQDDQEMAARSLAVLSGRTACVRTDGVTGNAILTYRDTLPKDLYPLLVLDASGRVRRTYQDVHRGTLIRLRTPPRTTPRSPPHMVDFRVQDRLGEIPRPV